MNLNNKSGMYIGHILALCTVVVWGTTFITTKILLVDFVPTEIAMFRFILAFVFLNIIKPKRLHIKDFKKELVFAGAGLAGITLYFQTENLALTYTTAANVGVIISAVPFFTAIVSKIFFGGKNLTKNFVIGFVVAIIGVFAISYNGASELSLNPIGDLLTIAAAITWAFYCNFVNKIGQWNYPTIQVTRRIFFYGILFMLPITFFGDFSWDITRLSENGAWLNILYLGIVASGIGYATWNFAVNKIGTIKTSVYLYFSPVVTIIASAIILQEPMNFVTFLGAGLTTLGLIISAREK
ncbi:MAG: DMT family transporter [Clostridia bacterium]